MLPVYVPVWTAYTWCEKSVYTCDGNHLSCTLSFQKQPELMQILLLVATIALWQQPLHWANCGQLCFKHVKGPAIRKQLTLLAQPSGQSICCCWVVRAVAASCCLLESQSVKIAVLVTLLLPETPSYATALRCHEAVGDACLFGRAQVCQCGHNKAVCNSGRYTTSIQVKRPHHDVFTYHASLLGRVRFIIVVMGQRRWL